MNMRISVYLASVLALFMCILHLSHGMPTKIGAPNPLCHGDSRRTYEGCICYLKFIDVFKSSGPRDGKAFAFGVFCPEVPGEFPNELKQYCSVIYKEWELRSKLPLLRSINKYLKVCKKKTIKDLLIEGSEYCKYFMKTHK